MGFNKLFLIGIDKISIIIFVSLNLVILMLYNIYVYIPHVHFDSLEYFNVAFNIKNFTLPVKLSSDIPIAYSIFLFLNKNINNNLNFIVLTQYIIFIVSGSFLIYQMFKLNLILGLSSIFTLLFISINDLTIEYNTSILTDSLFNSGIIALIAFVFKYLNKSTLSNFYLLTFIVFLLILLRSNGLIFIFIPLYFSIKRSKIIYHKMLAIIIIAISFSSINYIVKGDFFFTDYKRFSEKFVENKIVHAEKLVKKESYNEMLYKYSLHFFKDTKRYFFTFVHSNEIYFFKLKNTSFNQFHLNNHMPYKTFLSNDLQSYIFKGNTQGKIDQCLYDFNCLNHSKFFVIFDYFKKFLHIIKVIFFAIGFMSFICCILKNIKTIYTNVMILFFIFYLFMIFLLPILNPRFQDRYIWPFEILLLFFSIFYILNLIINSKFKLIK